MATNLKHCRKPQDIVKITLKEDGDTEQVFQVYKELLCRQSPFFEAAFEGPFSEGETQSMTLEDVGDNEFGIFLNWIHFKEIKGRYGQPGFLDLLQVWILADRFLVPTLQNEAIDLLYDLARNQYLAHWFFKQLVEYSEGPDIIQRFTMDALLGCKKEQLSKIVLQAMKPEMMLEFVERLKDIQVGEKFVMPPKSAYHVKTEGEEKGEGKETIQPHFVDSDDEEIVLWSLLDSPPRSALAPPGTMINNHTPGTMGRTPKSGAKKRRLGC